MIYNGQALYDLSPIADMLSESKDAHGTSYGLSEIGYGIRIAQDIHITKTSPRFHLASAMEYFDVPRGLCGRVTDKSTWARKGLSVFNTMIKPGWRGYLTLELVYHGTEDLFIPKGSGIAEVIFESLMDNTTYYTGRYQDQPAGAQPASFVGPKS